LVPALKNCLFAVTRPTLLETCKPKGFIAILAKKNFFGPKSWKENKLITVKLSRALSVVFFLTRNDDRK